MEFQFLQRLPTARTGPIDGLQSGTMNQHHINSSSYRISLAAEDLKSLD
jgi:hypothetical protein